MMMETCGRPERGGGWPAGAGGGRAGLRGEEAQEEGGGTADSCPAGRPNQGCTPLLCRLG